MNPRSLTLRAILSAAWAFALPGARTSLGAEEKNETFTDPEKAGVDYKLQGEYEGTAGSEKWGAQVIAMIANAVRLTCC